MFQKQPAVEKVLGEILRHSPRHAVGAQRVRVQASIQSVIGALRRRRPSVREVSELLRAGLRFLVDEGDLAMTIREVLEEPWDPTWHLLLFEADGKRRNESAVQILLHVVLTHKLERATSPVTTAIIREPSNRGRNEPDFEIHAHAGAHLVVPIEVKWDDHSEWKTALRTQLAERYCKTHRHGVYVVTTAKRDPETIRAALQEEVEAVAHDLGITVHVVVKDVREARWPVAQAKVKLKLKSNRGKTARPTQL